MQFFFRTRSNLFTIVLLLKGQRRRGTPCSRSLRRTSCCSSRITRCDILVEPNTILVEKTLFKKTTQDRAALEKNGKMLQAQIADLQSRLVDLQASLNEADGAKRKCVVENCDLQHHAEEAERSAAQLSKDKSSLTTRLDDAKRLADAEARERINLLGKMKNLEHEIELMREQLDEDYEAKQDLDRQLSKALADSNLWKTRQG